MMFYYQCRVITWSKQELSDQTRHLRPTCRRGCNLRAGRVKQLYQPAGNYPATRMLLGGKILLGGNRHAELSNETDCVGEKLRPPSASPKTCRCGTLENQNTAGQVYTPFAPYVPALRGIQTIFMIASR